MEIRKGSFGFNLPLIVKGLGDLTAKTLRVVIEREDGSKFERTTGAGDVLIVDGPNGEIDIKIIDATDLPTEGTYRYQVIDETGGKSIKTSIASFTVGEALELA